MRPENGGRNLHLNKIVNGTLGRKFGQAKIGFSKIYRLKNKPVAHNFMDGTDFPVLKNERGHQS